MIFLGLLNMLYHPLLFYGKYLSYKKLHHHYIIGPLNRKLDCDILTCLYGRFPLNPVATALTVWYLLFCYWLLFFVCPMHEGKQDLGNPRVLETCPERCFKYNDFITSWSSIEQKLSIFPQMTNKWLEVLWNRLFWSLNSDEINGSIVNV